MRDLTLALLVLALPALAHAEDVWRWRDSRGTVHYSNVERNVPAEATRVETRITIEASRLPGAPTAGLAFGEGEVVHADSPRSARAPRRAGRPVQAAPEPPRVYDEARLRFGCYTAGVLYYGGFSHADDISPVLNCYNYTLGPEAWLNAARAELAMRQAGIGVRDMLKLYGEEGGRQQ